MGLLLWQEAARKVPLSILEFPMKALLSAVLLFVSALPAVAGDCVAFAGKCLTENDKRLSLRLGPDLSDLAGIGALAWVEEVRLDGGGQTVDLAPLLALEKLIALDLKAVTITDTASLGQLPIRRLSLNEVGLEDAEFLQGLSGLRDFRMIRVSGPAPFDLSGLGPVETLSVVDTSLASLDGIAGQPNLNDLVLAHTGQADLSSLSSLNLRRATLRGEGLVDLSFLSGSPELGFLFLNGAEVTSLDGVPFGPAFRNLGAKGSALEDISALAAAVNLERVDLRESAVRDVAALAGKQRLEEVDLRETALSDLSPLVDLPSLKRLDLSDSQVFDLSPLAGLPSVEMLTLSRIPAIDLSPLAAMDQVKALWLNETRATDLTPLMEMDSLEAMRIDDARMVTKEGLADYIAIRVPPDN